MMTGLPTLLERLGVPQVELAQAIGVTEETVSRWVNGHKVPSSTNLLATLAFLQARDRKITIRDLTERAA